MRRRLWGPCRGDNAGCILACKLSVSPAGLFNMPLAVQASYFDALEEGSDCSAACIPVWPCGSCDPHSAFLMSLSCSADILWGAPNDMWFAHTMLNGAQRGFAKQILPQLHCLQCRYCIALLTVLHTWFGS